MFNVPSNTDCQPGSSANYGMYAKGPPQKGPINIIFVLRLTLIRWADGRISKRCRIYQAGCKIIALNVTRGPRRDIIYCSGLSSGSSFYPVVYSIRAETVPYML